MSIRNVGRSVRVVRVYDFVPPSGRYLTGAQMPEHHENIEQRVEHSRETAMVQGGSVTFEGDRFGSVSPGAYVVFVDGRWAGRARTVEEGLAIIDRARQQP